MKQIPLTKGKFALVDDEDYERVSTRKWYYHSGGYAVTTEPRPSQKKLLMHRFLMGDDAQIQIDHINGDKLDNRRSNLRYSNQQTNKYNQKKTLRKTHSKYKGVTWFARDGLWKGQIGFKNKNYHLGYFLNEEDAATAYNFKAHELFGEFANFNQVY